MESCGLVGYNSHWLSSFLWGMGVRSSSGSLGLRNKAQNFYRLCVLLLWRSPCLKSVLSKTADKQFRIFLICNSSLLLKYFHLKQLHLNICDGYYWFTQALHIIQLIRSSSAATKKLLWNKIKWKKKRNNNQSPKIPSCNVYFKEIHTIILIVYAQSCLLLNV